MQRKSPSLQTVVALCLLAMGAVALALVLFSAGIYRSVSHENRAAALKDIVSNEVRNRRQAMTAGQRIFALDLARNPAFRGAWRNGRGDGLDAVMRSALADAPADAALTGVRVLDAALDPAAEAGARSRGCPAPDEAEASPLASDRMAQRACIRAGVPVQSLLIPLPGIEPGGFVEVVSDPVAALARIGRDAGIALRIERPGGDRLYQTDDWQRLADGSDTVSTRYLTPAGANEPVFAIRAATGVGLLNEQLAATRDFVLLAAGSILALAILIALVSLRRLMQPLRWLQQAAENVSQERGVDDFVPVTAAGPPEIATPIRSFNAMVERVRGLVTELEGEVGQRRDAEVAANRARELAEAHARAASQAREFSQATLEAVVDAVIATDTEGRIEYINPVATQLTGVAEADAVGRPIDEVVALYDRGGQKRESHLVDRCVHERRTTGARRIGRLAGAADADDGEMRYVDYALVPMRDRGGAVVGAVLIFHDVTEAQRMTERLRWQATHDSLTGLINRYEFENRLHQVLQSARDDAGAGVLCYLDLDQFKLVNDTCGHVAGDELLRQLSFMLGDRLAGRGTLARLGGDEFGLLLHPCGIPAARAIAEDLREAIQQFRFVWTEHIFTIGVSIGVVSIDAESPSTDILLSAADTACYMAKDQGRNRVQVYEADDAALQARHAEMHWVTEINRALEEDRLILYCQDIVDAVTPEPVRHFEILLRMADGDGTIRQPGSFLPAAERYNLAPAIDEWVVRHALAWIASNDVPDDALYSINLSGRSLASDGFLDTVLGEMDRYAVSPRNLCFEVTETAAISNLASARAFMEALRARGCRFSLDDFGSGLSSFNYLQNLPVDFLKIDGAFVRDIHSNPVHQSIVRSMNDVGHALGMYTIAEFVENDAVIEVLRGIGVDFLQGYGYARPRPLEAVRMPAGVRATGD
ncbi:EAL domain-containing protein [Halofilum ochraceum]|uniref:EAL domain-containing protein n=1 Tax=Halofilum ochraceum TaxID=1611323 RepID=UPI000AE8B211|nr:EAL domain-containing protein [Halofilum ochraceum]